MENEQQKTKKQHAVPQNIMEVEFKLVGDMTIRQFLYVAVGGILCYLIYSGGLPFLIRWFLIPLIAFLALGMAFLPMEERGMDEWIRNFFTACYSPTQRIWKKYGLKRVEGKGEAKAVPKLSEKIEARPKEAGERVPKREEVRKVTEELRTVAKKVEKKKLSERSLEQETKKISQNLDRILARIARPKEVLRYPLQEENRGLEEKVRKLSGELEKLKKLEGMEEISPDIKETLSFYREEAKSLEGKTKTLEEELAQEKAKKEGREDRFAGEEEYRKQIATLKEENKTLTDKILRTAGEVEKLRAEVGGFSEEKESYTHSLSEKEEELQRLEEERNRAVSKLMRFSSEIEKLRERGALPGRELTQEMKREAVVETRPKEPAKPKGERVFEEPTPLASNIPNTISGVVEDSEGKLLPGIMVVVEDEDGDPVRAIKTNKLGQFSISTPLPNGNYTVRVESKERKFSPVRITCDGSIRKPVVFR